MISKRQIHNLVAAYWVPSLLYAGLVLAVGSLLWFHLRTLTGGFSPDELATFHAGNSFRHILDNPVNAPYLVLVRLLLFLHEDSLIFLRLIASLFGLLTLTTFYWLVRYWHGGRSAALGTIVFGCSAWFLHTTRLGTPDVLLFLLLGLAACITWLKRTDNRFALLLGFLLVASLIYVPGMIWFLVLGLIWQFKTVVRLIKRHGPMMLAGLGGMLVLLTPLIWGLYKSPKLAKTLAGLPATGWPDPVESLRRLADIPIQLTLHGPVDPQRWLGTLPILSAFSIVMLFLGGYLYSKHWHMSRAKVMVTALAVGILLVALGGAVNISIIIPFLYVLVAAGVGFMLDKWYRVFPRNAIAQWAGLGLIIVAVAASCWYGLRHYFVAWPNAPATRQVFTIKQ